MRKKNYEELELKDDFMFGKVMGNRELCREVEQARHNKKWRREYMKTLLHDMEVREEGREEGLREGEDRVAQLVTKLIALNRTLDIDRAASDKEYRKKLMTELGI